MSIVSVTPKSFILALFIRDDDERFLLGDSGYDFKDSQLHFVANTMENDEVAKQGADGVMLAGQVRRASVQPFDGYIGDATDTKDQIEEKRKAFIAFFAKGHHFRVVYVDCNRNAWQRKGGYIVDAPEVKEIWQIHPEYHVGLNFEDVNYYSYNEDAQGQEILANQQTVPLSTAGSGGLEWDSVGAVAEDAVIEGGGTEYKTAQGQYFTIDDAASTGGLRSLEIIGAPLKYQTTGTPSTSSPVAINYANNMLLVEEQTGKNYVNMEYPGDISVYSSGLSIENGVFKLNGNLAGQSRQIPLIPFRLPSDIGTITFSSTVSGSASGSTATVNLQFWTGSSWQRVGSSNWSVKTAGTNSLTYTVQPNNSNIFRIVFTISNLTGTNLEVRLQVEKGSTRTTWEAPTKTTRYINLGLNMFDKTAASQGYTLDANSGGTVADATMFASDYIPVYRGTVYYINNDIDTGPDTSNIMIYYDSAKQKLSSGNYLDYTVGAPPRNMNISNVAYVRFSAKLTALDTMKMSPMFRLPYFTATPKINLGAIGTAVDKIYEAGGKWYKHKAIAKIDSYNGESVGSTYMSTTGGLDTGATVYYALAEPIEEEITDATIKASLDSAKAMVVGSTAKTISVVTANPSYIYDETPETTIKIEYPTSSSSPGKVVGGGYVWEEGTSGGPTTIMNDSISDVSPIWTVQGPVLNPILENTTTGEEIEYVGMVAEGQTLVIDMGEQTATLNGLNVVSNVVGDFLSLAPGWNTLLYSTSNGDEDSQIGWSEIVG